MLLKRRRSQLWKSTIFIRRVKNPTVERGLPPKLLAFLLELGFSISQVNSRLNIVFYFSEVTFFILKHTDAHCWPLNQFLSRVHICVLKLWSIELPIRLIEFRSTILSLTNICSYFGSYLGLRYMLSCRLINQIVQGLSLALKRISIPFLDNRFKGRLKLGF